MRPGWGPPGPGWGPPTGPGGGGFCCGICDIIAACLSFLCCCWLLEDCFGGPMGPGPGPGPFGPPGAFGP